MELHPPDSNFLIANEVRALQYNGSFQDCKIVTEMIDCDRETDRQTYIYTDRRTNTVAQEFQLTIIIRSPKNDFLKTITPLRPFFIRNVFLKLRAML